MRIYIVKPAERDIVVPILVHNGYTVSEGKEKQGSRVAVYLEVEHDRSAASKGSV